MAYPTRPPGHLVLSRNLPHGSPHLCSIADAAILRRVSPGGQGDQLERVMKLTWIAIVMLVMGALLYASYMREFSVP